MTNKVKTLVMSAALVAAGALGVAAPVSATTVFCPDWHYCFGFEQLFIYQK